MRAAFAAVALTLAGAAALADTGDTYVVRVVYCQPPSADAEALAVPDTCVRAVHLAGMFDKLAHAQDHARQLHRDGLLLNDRELIPSSRFLRVRVVQVAAKR
jgi:hypothetical protein